MADTELGRAVVPIRASLDELDKDLGEARSKISTVLGTVGKAVGGAVAGIGAAGVGAAAVLGSLAVEAAPLEGIANSFAGVADNADEMIAALREGSQGMASDADLMTSYNSAAQLVGKTFADQLPGAMEYLGKVSAATGEDMGFMIDSLVKGVGRLSGPILDNLGIQVSMTEAVALWAEESGMAATQTIDNAAAMEELHRELVKTDMQLEKATESMEAMGEETSSADRTLARIKVEELTAKIADYEQELAGLSATHGTTFEDFDALTESMTKAQQQEAMMALVMQKLAENTAEMPDVAENASTKLAQMETTMANLKAEIGMALLPVLKQVLDALAPLAEKYGPMLTETFGRLAEMLGPLLGTALETLIPLIMNLLDALIPLAEMILTNLFPAFSVILQAVVQLAGALIEGLAPVLDGVQKALIPVIMALVEMLAPILVELASGILPLVAKILVSVAGVFGRLLMAVMPLVGALLSELVPVLLEILDAVLPELVDVFLVLVDVFLDIIELILPVWTDLLVALIPLLGSIAVLLAEGIGWALEALAQLIENVVQPIMEWWIRTILEPMIEIVDRIIAGIKSVTDWFKNLTETVRSLDLPGWMTPGSPTPLELGLRGIASELRTVDRLMSGWAGPMGATAVAGGSSRQWFGDLHLHGVRDPQAAADAVLRVMRDRGMISGTSLR